MNKYNLTFENNKLFKNIGLCIEEKKMENKREGNLVIPSLFQHQLKVNNKSILKANIKNDIELLSSNVDNENTSEFVKGSYKMSEAMKKRKKLQFFEIPLGAKGLNNLGISYLKNLNKLVKFQGNRNELNNFQNDNNRNIKFIKNSNSNGGSFILKEFQHLKQNNNSEFAQTTKKVEDEKFHSFLLLKGKS